MSTPDAVVSIEFKINLTAEQLAGIDPVTVSTLMQALRDISAHMSVRPMLHRLSTAMENDAKRMTNTADVIDSLDSRLKPIEEYILARLGEIGSCARSEKP